MRSLLNLVKGLAIVVSSFLLISFIAWLLTDTGYTYKQCVQTPVVFFISFILSVFANVAYFADDNNQKALH